MAKFKVVQRPDSNHPMLTEEKVIDFDGSLDELLAHAHIVSAEKVVEEKKEDHVKSKEEDKPKHK